MFENANYIYISKSYLFLWVSEILNFCIKFPGIYNFEFVIYDYLNSGDLLAGNTSAIKLYCLIT
jgi:hypothetical protein